MQAYAAHIRTLTFVCLHTRTSLSAFLSHTPPRIRISSCEGAETRRMHLPSSITVACAAVSTYEGGELRPHDVHARPSMFLFFDSLSAPPTTYSARCDALPRIVRPRYMPSPFPLEPPRSVHSCVDSPPQLS
jgi:hypothetical protein